MEVVVENGKAVSVRGDDEHPESRGGSKPMGQVAVHRPQMQMWALNSSERLTCSGKPAQAFDIRSITR
jgi:hypothetical protein